MTQTSTKPKKPKVAYSIEEGNPSKIFREAEDKKEQIALYDSDSGIVEMVPEFMNYRAKVSQWLSEENLKFKEYAEIGTDFNIRGDKSNSIPPRPKKNPRLGTKTRAVVEWYAKYHPDVFRSKYGVRELQELVRIDKDDTQIRAENGDLVSHTIETKIYETVDGFDYDLRKLKNGEQRLIADCLTHLTMKMNNENSDNDSDWDLDK